ncbi:tol-pal system-associated acyl-CoA thioesterase [Acuticoccus sediminis]|uniref:Tol-pal system-associated acyl-CoA thioesterase n=1 Tax=Acuticoccus sediminis TaxID=2184697 RepID=A0A8B2NW78_9HYPH|nr:YbgC/FadM family acyl-CoA thioesterase [Acuticoccus sediminis]RAI03101.1 tol-pal system-associated acyl-CoA thioesterase [Acuticoccus sediminis]
MSTTFATEVRVYFEDTDFSGRVYHGAYIRFLERGRTELLRASGLDHAALAAQDPPIYFTLRRIDVTFHGPAVIDDLLTIETSPIEAGRANFLLDQRILRESTRLVSARAELCLIDARGRPQRPSPEVRAALSPTPV